MRYEVLGPVEAKREDVVVAVGGPQQRRLLALLLSRPGQSVSAERLVDCLWPDGLAPEGAGRSVMTYVSRLRAALGESSISTVREGYCLELDGSTLDAVQFETLLSEAGTAEPGRAVEIYDRALALWTGSAYGEFGSEWWLLAEASRLNELLVVAMEERAEALVALGRHHRVIPELNRLANDHPLRERPVSLLMQALFATGRHADAFREFQSFRARLGEETGLEPSDELTALERSLAAGRPSPQPSARARLLRGYAIHEVLGEGAYGRVFAATQPGTDREVAIKAIRPDLSDSPEFIQRFEAEAQLVARLEHPHIVPLYDYWREPGGAYLVFRLLLGGTALGAMVSDGQFSVARVSRLVEEVGSALLAAHTAGVVHCDIKPSNVLFDEAGNAYLSDFGIAVTSSMQSQTGDRTRMYAAPELVDRTGDTVRSDIFSFGCMLWELLSGRSPLPVMQPSSRFRLPSLAGSIAERGELIDAVLARATSADPEVRFESMAELIIAWRDAVGRPEGVLSPMGPTSSSSPDSSRRRAVRALSTTMSSAVNPYKGLRPFAEADASEFFGRDDVAALLHQTLMSRGFVVVVGPSGSGKSSLVHAGLVPLLRNDGVRVATMVPGDRPTVALRQALRQVAATDSDSNDPIEWLNEAVSDGSGKLVLVVDQFEECWTLADDIERERFLSAVVVAGNYGVRCITTVRADLYDRPLQHASIGQMVADGTFALPPLSPQALEEVVARPAEQHGVDFEDGVVTAVVAEANAHPAGLPLLQFAMAELYERRVDNCITSRSFNELGGLGGAIGRRAEDIYNSLSEDMRTQTRHLFGRLVAPGHGAPDTRRRARFSELSEHDRAVADRFVQARLLVADRDLATREPVIEVAHEALLSNWPRLREWLEADRRWLAQLQHLATATRTWDEALRPDSELYRGSRLEGALEALPDHSEQLSSDEHAFVDASRTARDAGLERERRNALRLRRRLVATAALLVLALIAGAIAFTQRQQARESADSARVARDGAEADRAVAESEKANAQSAQGAAESSKRDAEIEALVGRSLSLRATQRDTAALLAVEAYQMTNIPRTRSALFSTFTANPGVLGVNQLPENGGDRWRGIVLPDGTALVMGHDNRFRQYDLNTGEFGDRWPSPFDTQPYLSRLVSSADGRLVAQLGWTDNGVIDITEIGVFDTTSHESVMDPVTVDYLMDNGTFSPDGSRLYVGGGPEGNVTAISIPDGNVIAELRGLTPPADSTLWSTTAGVAYVAGDLLAVGTAAGPIRLVDPITLAEVDRIDTPRGTTEILTAFGDGEGLIGQGQRGTIRVDVASRSQRWRLNLSQSAVGAATPCAITEPTDRVYCGDQYGRLEEHDLSTGALVRTIDAQNGSVGLLLIARDGAELVSIPDVGAFVSRWRLDGSGLVSRRIAGGYTPVSYSPDGKLLIAYHETEPSDQTPDDPDVLDPTTGGPVDPLDGLVFAGWNTNRTLIGTSINEDGMNEIEGYDLDTGSRKASTVTFPPDQSLAYQSSWLCFERSSCSAMTFASEHRLWVEIRDTTGQVLNELWTIDTDTLQRIEPTFHLDWLLSGSGTADGSQVVVSTGAGDVLLLDGRSGGQLSRFTAQTSRPGTSKLKGATIAPGGRLITTGFRGDLIVWDIETHKVLHTLSGTRGDTLVEVSADGKLAVARGGDRSVTLYDVASGEQIGDRLIITDAEVVATALRPDGKELAIGGGFGHELLVWDLDPEHWVTAACKLAGRNLNEDEWATYIGDLAAYHPTCPEYA